MAADWGFQCLLENLPSKVSSVTAKNLSVPIAFVCLLHLANEKVRAVDVHSGLAGPQGCLLLSMAWCV